MHETLSSCPCMLNVRTETNQFGSTYGRDGVYDDLAADLGSRNSAEGECYYQSDVFKASLLRK